MLIRAGISPCPNDVFTFAGLISGAIRPRGFACEFHFHDLETLNRSALSGEYGLVKISYAHAGRCQARYRLLDCGGALGRGCGPLLLSRDGDFRPDRPVLVPGEFTTANFLLDFCLAGQALARRAEDPSGREHLLVGRPPEGRFPTGDPAAPQRTAAERGPATVSKEFMPFDALYRRLCAEQGSQGVVIHEKRFVYRGDGLLLVRDLGAYWEEQTGFPIPLGAVGLRSDIIAALGTEAVESAVRLSLAWAREHEAAALELCRAHAQDLSMDVIREHVRLYVNDFSLSLGDEGRLAVQRLLALASGNSHIPRALPGDARPR